MSSGHPKILKPFFKVHSFGQSDIGPIREKNEDIFIEYKKHQFYALADGMGGHKAGEVAAQETVVYLCNCISKMFNKSPSLRTQDISQNLSNYIKHSNTRIYQLGKENSSYKGMGTTLCSLLFYDKFLIHAHVGDSRIYRYRDSKLIQMTYDHTLQNKLTDTGKLDEYIKKGVRYKNILTKAIGAFKSVMPDMGIARVFPGDLYLMCSDGLSDFVTDEEISSILAGDISLETATKALIDKAKLNRGNDNITVLVMKAED